MVLVTYYYVEQSTGGQFDVKDDMRLSDVRRETSERARKLMQENWGDGVAPHPDPSSILLRSYKMDDVLETEDKCVRDVCQNGELLTGIVPTNANRPPGQCAPAPMISIFPSMQESPMFQQKENLQGERSRADTLSEKLELVLSRTASLEAAFEKQKKQIEAAFEKQKKQLEEERKEEKKQLDQERKEQRKQLDQERKEKKTLKDEIKKINQQLEEERKEKKTLKDDIKKINQQLEQVNQKLEQEKARHSETRARLAEVDAATMETVGWVATRDKEILRHIKLRHLLNVAQQKLAIAANLTTSKYGASEVWRSKLDSFSKTDLKIRLREAKELFTAPDLNVDERTRKFLHSEGMSLVVDPDSWIRNLGNSAAHPQSTPRRMFEDVIQGQQDLEDLTDFACDLPTSS